METYMMNKIKPEHLQRLAGVYIRQSSPGQVKNNRESYRVQKGLATRAEALGWHTDRIKCFEGDQGVSASTPMARNDFDLLLQMIQDKQVGIIFSVDVARLARNSIDLSMLIHWCAVHRTLIADQHQVYDPATPEDSLVLGIQGVLAVSELHAIRKRLQAGLDEKASRGELHQGVVPRGYVVVDGLHLRKHPDRRVQQVIGRVLDKFESCSSVSALLRWTWEQKIELPRAASGGDGMRIEWVQPNYRGLIDMLRNPKYAGVYVHPRYQQETHVLASGKVQIRRRLSRPDQWTTVLKDHHPAYITLAQHEANWQKITMNAQRYTSSRGAVNRGASLLAGLIQCRRCGHTMQVSYSDKGRVSYDCRNGRRQRDASASRCFRFSADELERQLTEQVLYAVSPAGVAAAELAAERLASERASRRVTLSDQLEQLHYEADLTRRRLDAVDPANRLVFGTLTDEWELNLRAVSDHELLLSEFDSDDPPRPTAAEHTLLEQLGERLENVWHDASTDGRLKQQVVRLLVDHAYAELDEEKEEVVVWLKWSSGHHTELRSARRGARRRGKQTDIAAILQTLRKIANDESISRALNRHGLTTASGQTWTKQRVAECRRQSGIPNFSEREKSSEGWLTQQEAATKLGISPMSLNRLIHRGIAPAEGERGLPQVIREADLSSEAIEVTVKQIRGHTNAPLPTNPNQKTLFF
jgi:DNA invertase Pin-like site-specific DNA recombinase